MKSKKFIRSPTERIGLFGPSSKERLTIRDGLPPAPMIVEALRAAGIEVTQSGIKVGSHAKPSRGRERAYGVRDKRDNSALPIYPVFPVYLVGRGQAAGCFCGGD